MSKKPKVYFSLLLIFYYQIKLYSLILFRLLRQSLFKRANNNSLMSHIYVIEVSIREYVIKEENISYSIITKDNKLFY